MNTMNTINTINTINTKVYLCTGCNQIFSIQKSLDMHYLYCVYYNYKKVTICDYMNNECIEPIIKILSVISRYDINNIDFLNLNDILINSLFKDNNIIFQNIYNTLNNLKIDYISYNELMHVISKNVTITDNELNLLIVCYKQCKKNINNIF